IWASVKRSLFIRISSILTLRKFSFKNHSFYGGITGDAKAVLSAHKVLIKSGKKSIAVRDADQGVDKSQNIFALPGSLPPEKEVFCSKASKLKLSELYRFDAEAFLSSHPDMDHHEYFPRISGKLSCSREVLESDCIRGFLDDVGDDWSRDLCENIKKQII
ncbi:hypothetical protein, partial [Acetobacter pasteurianus]|uniref:hypothetical protein n=1 Tax=Acetobacter pasteurianus TaxID=438 RepID=UPI0018F890EC